MAATIPIQYVTDFLLRLTKCVQSCLLQNCCMRERVNMFTAYDKPSSQRVIFAMNPFPLDDAFWHIYSRQLLKLFWHNEQFLLKPQCFQQLSSINIILYISTDFPFCCPLLQIYCNGEMININPFVSYLEINIVTYREVEVAW